MEDVDLKVITPQNTGWLEMQLPEKYIDILWKYIEESKKENVDHRPQLVGNIASSILLTDTDNYFFNNILEKLCNIYLTSFPTSANYIVPYVGKKCPWKLDGMWVNFQNKGEFNPIHHHQGSFSFVIWMKIPTNFEDQKQLPFAKDTRKPSAGNFEFSYSNMMGWTEQYEYYMNKDYEGTMLFFPAKLMHQVYPFFESDEERISISGNVCLDIK
tara:strand:+ start:799 stop:1440 length:642 start_codon:yes stop_codon:yes gene_type:complete